MNTQEKASLIQLKISALVKQVKQLEQELEMAKMERVKLEENLKIQTKTIEILEDKNKISKLADGIHLGKQDVTEMKFVINRYVREIDECLKLLNHLPNNN
jgi:uncharacterized coiled-coil DUF342 family protein